MGFFKRKIRTIIVILIAAAVLIFSGIGIKNVVSDGTEKGMLTTFWEDLKAFFTGAKEVVTDVITIQSGKVELKDIPEYSGTPYVVINDNVPGFSEKDKKSTEAFENYSELDSLGRCGVAYANICKELMPTEERGSIGHIKPSGWVQAKYEGLVNSNPPYLYNRCHLIAFCLAGENDNEKNLITGTRYFNVEGMLPFEETVAKYMDSHPDNHVLYRVTPIYKENDLVARGVQMEAWSVEDDEIHFNVFAYNVQPGVEIDYATGCSKIK